MELYYGIIQVKRTPWIPGESRNPKGLPGTARARPWDPPGTALGPPSTPLGPQGTPLGSLGTPADPTDHKNIHTSTNLQRQKLSIAASESFRCNASPQDAPGSF